VGGWSLSPGSVAMAPKGLTNWIVRPTLQPKPPSAFLFSTMRALPGLSSNTGDSSFTRDLKKARSSCLGMWHVRIADKAPTKYRILLNQKHVIFSSPQHLEALAPTRPSIQCVQGIISPRGNASAASRPYLVQILSMGDIMPDIHRMSSWCGGASMRTTLLLYQQNINYDPIASKNPIISFFSVHTHTQTHTMLFKL
jgi:hypothetical protein